MMGSVSRESEQPSTRFSVHSRPRDAMSAESTGLGAIELEPLVSLPPVPEGPEGIAEFWINMAREEILAIKEEHKNSSERKDAIIDVLRKELEAARASALHWQTMYTAKAPAKEPELLADVAAYPALQRAACAALDSQITGEMPLEYHAISELQSTLKKHVAQAEASTSTL